MENVRDVVFILVFLFSVDQTSQVVFFSLAFSTGMMMMMVMVMTFSSLTSSSIFIISQLMCFYFYWFFFFYLFVFSLFIFFDDFEFPYLISGEEEDHHDGIEK